MKRVAIVGTPGSGKSTLARELGWRLGLPVIHLDQHRFLPGWQRKPDEEWKRLADELLQGDRWVMDGAFEMETALERADTVVFLDFPRWRGYAGSIKRLALAQMGRPAPDFAPGCEDKLDKDFWRLLQTIHMFPAHQRVEVAAQVEARRAEGARVVVLQRRSEVRQLLERVRQKCEICGRHRRLALLAMATAPTGSKPESEPEPYAASRSISRCSEREIRTGDAGWERRLTIAQIRPASGLAGACAASRKR